MRHRAICVLAASALAVGAGAHLSASSESKFEARLKDARRNAQSAVGRRYEAALGRSFDQKYGPRIAACRSRNPQAGQPAVELLLKLGADGRPLEGLVRPETPLSTCIRDAMLHAALQSPPFAGYWLYVALGLR